MDTTKAIDYVKVIVIDAGKTPIGTERYEFLATEGVKIKETILAALNRMGKASHALIRYKNKYWTADHTATGNAPSKEYYRHEVTYHPYMADLV